MNVSFVIKKTLRLMISLLLFSFLLYGLLALSTGDPALGVLRRLGVNHVSPEALEATRVKLGMDGAFLERYFKWLLQCLQGNFGYSFQSNIAVRQLMVEKLSITIQLVSSAFIICLFMAVTIGSLIGNFPALNWLNQIVSVVLSFPIYWMAIATIFLFGVQLKLFPFVGSSTTWHLVLPIFVLSLSEGCYLTKMTGDLLSISAISERQTIAKFRHIKWYYRLFYQLKDVFVPLLTLSMTSLIHLFSGVIMIEIIFSISGIGKLLMEAISTRDYPVIQGITLLLACVTFILNYVVDLLIQKIDRRIQLERGGQA
jgi:peptide/nickel transport system permease protein